MFTLCKPMGEISACLYVPEGRRWKASWALTRSAQRTGHFDSARETWSTLMCTWMSFWCLLQGKSKGLVLFLASCPPGRTHNHSVDRGRSSLSRELWNLRITSITPTSKVETYICVFFSIGYNSREKMSTYPLNLQGSLSLLIWWEVFEVWK